MVIVLKRWSLLKDGPNPKEFKFKPEESRFRQRGMKKPPRTVG